MKKTLPVGLFLVALLLLSASSIYFGFLRSPAKDVAKAPQTTATAVPDMQLNPPDQTPDSRAARELPPPESPAAAMDALRKERIMQAEAAARLARDMAERERREREAQWQQLNEMLNREAQARRDAETASHQLEQRLDLLQSELEAARARQSELARQSEEVRATRDTTHEELIAGIRQRDRELQALAKERERLLRERAERFEQQIILERKIIESGGEITVSGYRRVWSPNYRPVSGIDSSKK